MYTCLLTVRGAGRAETFSEHHSHPISTSWPISDRRITIEQRFYLFAFNSKFQRRTSWVLENSSSYIRSLPGPIWSEVVGCQRVFNDRMNVPFHHLRVNGFLCCRWIGRKVYKYSHRLVQHLLTSVQHYRIQAVANGWNVHESISNGWDPICRSTEVYNSGLLLTADTLPIREDEHAEVHNPRNYDARVCEL